MKFLTIILLLTLLPFSNVFCQRYERYKHLLDTTIHSAYLGYDKGITITVPFEWEKDVDRAFPLVIVFDRQNKRSHQYMLNTIDYLTSNEQMPSAVIVGVESVNHRHSETSYKVSTSTGKGEENERFIFDELIPLLRKRFKASPFTMLIGHSRYGYFTTSLMINRFEELNAVISLSPFFTQHNVNLVPALVDRVSKTELGTFKYYRYGIGDDYPDDYEAVTSALDSISQINVFFSHKGWLFPQADHNVTPGLTISNALYGVFEFWSKQQRIFIDDENPDLSLEAELLEKLKKHYGQTLVFSIGILNGKGWQFYNAGKYQKAIEAWQLLLRYYPNFSQAYLSIIQAQKKLKLDTQATVKTFKVNLENSSIYTKEQKREFLEQLR